MIRTATKTVFWPVTLYRWAFAPYPEDEEGWPVFIRLP